MKLKLLLVLRIGAAGFSLIAASNCLAAAGDVNSVNTAPASQSGIYINTASSHTVFQNSSGGGLWLHSGSTVNGLETTSSNTSNGNGGTLYFQAPGSVVRLDGNIDVTAIRNGTLYTANGGKVFLDSAYLFQNGNIYASGSVKGKLTQVNVVGQTISTSVNNPAAIVQNPVSINTSMISALSVYPGHIGQTVLDSTGKFAGRVDANVIGIVGNAVYHEDHWVADGVENQNGVVRLVYTGKFEPVAVLKDDVMQF